jgi:hypothetical protein
MPQNKYDLTEMFWLGRLGSSKTPLGLDGIWWASPYGQP